MSLNEALQENIRLRTKLLAAETERKLDTELLPFGKKERMKERNKETILERLKKTAGQYKREVEELSRENICLKQMAKKKEEVVTDELV